MMRRENGSLLQKNNHLMNRLCLWRKMLAGKVSRNFSRHSVLIWLWGFSRRTYSRSLLMPRRTTSDKYKICMINRMNFKQSTNRKSTLSNAYKKQFYKVRPNYNNWWGSLNRNSLRVPSWESWRKITLVTKLTYWIAKI